MTQIVRESVGDRATARSERDGIVGEKRQIMYSSKFQLCVLCER